MKSRPRYYQVSLLVTLGMTLILALALVATPSVAAPPLPSGWCDEIELVLVVDQSGSMPGSPQHPVPNDPLGLRFDGPQHVVSWMGGDYVVANGVFVPGRPPITYHVALVDFGSDAQIGLDWRTIAPASQNDWDQMRADLEQSLSAQARGVEDGNLGNTNYVAALELARDLFSRRSAQQQGCPRRALFLLTDGRPYLDREEDPGFTIPSHMREVKNLVQEDPAQEDLADLGVEVWVTGINDSGENYWQRVLPYWEDTLPPDEVGRQPHALRVDTHDEIGDRLTALLMELTKRDIQDVKIGPREVGPFLQQVIFTFYKRDIREHLDIHDEAGPLTPGRTDVEVEVYGHDEAIESLVVNRPLPGTWEIQTTAPRADVKIDEIPVPAPGVFREPLDQGTVQYTQDRLAFQMVDSEGRPLPDYADPLYQLTISATVSAQGKTWPVSFVAEPNQTYAASFVPVETGQHQLSIQATSRRPIDGDPAQMEVFTVLDEVIGGFQVQPVQVVAQGPPTIQSTTEEGCPPQVGDSASLRYQVQRADTDAPVSLSLPVAWEAQISGPVQAQPVAIEGPDASAVYSMSAPFDEPGLHRLAVWAEVTDLEGDTHELINDPRALEVDVAPVLPVGIEIAVQQPADTPWWWNLLDKLGLLPKDPTQFIARDPLWHWLPVEVEARVVISSTASIPDPTVALTNLPASGLPIEVLAMDPAGSHVQTVSLVPTATPGHYRAQVPDLQKGRFRLLARFAPGVQANCGYYLAQGAEVEPDRVENPIILAQYGLVVLVLLVMLLLILRWWCRRRNSVDGYVTVLGESGRPVDGWYQSIAGRNRWVFRDVPASTTIAEMQVRSTRSKCGREPLADGRVRVTLILISEQGSKPRPPIETELERGKTVQLPRLPGHSLRYVLEDDEL